MLRKQISLNKDHSSLFTGSNRWMDFLPSRRNSHLMIFIYKVLLLKFPAYLISSLLVRRSGNCLTFIIPHVRTSVGRAGFRCYAPFKCNAQQTGLKLQSHSPLGDRKALLSDVFCDSCSRFCHIPFIV